jgi:hypothetical protein
MFELTVAQAVFLVLLLSYVAYVVSAAPIEGLTPYDD